MGGGLSTWVVAWAPPATVRQSFAPRMRRCHTLIMDRGSLLSPPPLLAKLLSLSLFCQPLPFPISPQLLVCRASPLHSLQLGFHDVPLPHDHDVFSSIPLLQSSSSSPLFYCLIHLIVSVIPVAPLSCILPTERTVRLLTSSCEVQHRTRYPRMLLTIMSIECEALPISRKLGRLDCK